MKELNKKNIRDILCLTPTQEGMLYHYLKEPGQDVYVVQLCLEISGDIYREPFETAWNTVIETNQALRTVFRWENVKDPVQIILKEYKCQPKFYDFQGTGGQSRQRWLEEIKAQDRKETFDLREVPFRVTLCKGAEDNYEMIISNHHIIYDGWSTGIILKEFFDAYDALYKGETYKPPVKTEYKEFIKWIHQRDMAEQEAFWRNYLNGFGHPTMLPIKKKKDKEIKRTGNVRFTLGREKRNELECFIKTYKITSAALFYSAWGLLLQRYGNSGDVIFGTTVSGRSAGIPGIEDMVGLFINTLPLRIQTFSNEKIADFLQRIDNALRAREPYEASSLVKVKETSDIDNNEEPFDTIVIIENYPLDSRLTAGDGPHNNRGRRPLIIDSYEMVEVPHYDLTVFIKEFKHIEFIFVYHKEVFDEDCMMKLTGHFRCIVRDILENPGKKAISIGILTREEKNELLFEFNDTPVKYPKEKTIHRLFEEQSERTPDRVAVKMTGPNHMTYSQLNEKSGQLSGVLMEKGVKPGAIMGIMMDRSIEMITGILGVLKAGGAYLPMDPGYPRERIRYMLKDSGTPLLLTRGDMSGKCKELGFDGEVIDVLKHNDKYSREKKTGLINIDTSIHPAYVIYTSGSSGKPRGISIRHRNVVNFMMGIRSKIGFKEGKSILSLTTVSFDIFVLETLLPLTGALTVIMANEREQKELGLLGNVILNHRVDMLQLTPSILDLLMEERDNLVDLNCVTQLMVGGERFPGHLYRQLRSTYNGKIYNLYGPTETTVWSTLKELSGLEDPDIGTPIANTRVYILDRYDNLQPVGIAGELCIGGDGVAGGYLNNPGLTCEKFKIINYKLKIKNGSGALRANLNAFGETNKKVPGRNYENHMQSCSHATMPLSPHPPIPPLPHSPIYLTGDLACWNAEGTLRFLGRMDAQVKIRGFRIEPGEIEIQLMTHQNVKQAVVTVHKGENNEKYLAAYIVSDDAIRTSTLRGHLLQTVPDYMVPAYFVRLEKIPLTPNGKVNRNALPRPGGLRPELCAAYAAPKSHIEKVIGDTWRELLKLDKVGLDDNFFDLGGNSFTLIRVSSRLKEAFKRDIPIVTLFNHSTIRTLARHLSGEKKNEDKSEESKRPAAAAGAGSANIAVIGMAGRFPGAGNIARFWENLKNGVESISFFNHNELEDAGIEPRLLKDPGCVKAKGVLEDVEYFDASFFEFNAVEARLMDPQVRLFHEYAWAALEDAGVVPGEYRGSIGLYAGSTANFPWLAGKSGYGLSASEQYELVNLNSDYFSTLVSYKLNLRGPSISIHTACSTSLVAIVMACRALMDGVCHIALAGSAGLTFPVKSGYVYQEGMVFAPDGHCRAFDAVAGGTVSGNGIGIVVLKPLEEAVAHGDHIHAVIKGTAFNNDGKRKVGYTAPSVEGQAEVITTAWQNAGFALETAGYIETHGTGTSLGDPIEIEGLKQAFKNVDLREGSVPIGSVKTNIGHLDTAAGVAGFIKTVLALKHKRIPPSLHFETPNPNIDFDTGPFYVNTRLMEWKSVKHPLRAGVSSFGIGGTNAHVVLEEWSGRHSSEAGRGYQLMVLSAKTPSALDRMAGNLAGYLEKNPGIHLADAAYTMQTGREDFQYRRMAVCSTVNEALSSLSSHGPGDVHEVLTGKGNRNIVFMFSGQGSQYVNMGRDLYRTEPLFREEMDHCFKILEPLIGCDIKEIIYPSSGDTDHSESINRTEFTQPLLFTIEYALANLLIEWGIKPSAMIGHSIGEYTAACLSGVFSLEDALKLVVLRGRLMQAMPTGSMVSVPLGEEELTPLMGQHLDLAAVNAPGRCVVSGPHDAVQAFTRQLREKGHDFRILETSHAFHSLMMDPMLTQFEDNVRRATMNEPAIPYISNVTGTWVTAAQVLDPAYWAKHLRRTVRFSGGIHVLSREENAVFIEVGPGSALATLARLQTNTGVLNLLRHWKKKIPDHCFLLEQIGRLWLWGVNIDWSAYYRQEKRYRVPLPTYPFERSPYPVTVKTPQTTPGKLAKKREMADWFYAPLWEKSITLPPKPLETGTGGQSNWLVFSDDIGLGVRLREKLDRHGQSVITVSAGSRFVENNPREFIVNPGQESHYNRLFARLQELKIMPGKILHLWSITGDTGEEGVPGFEHIDESQDRGFYSLLYLARTIGGRGISGDIQIGVVTDNMQEVLGVEALRPEKATVLGALQVIPLEYPNIRCCGMDTAPALPLSHARPGSRLKEKLPDYILAEFAAGLPDPVIAFRGNHRWVRVIKSVPIDKTADEAVNQSLREGGVYLITGGTGGIGLTLAQYLARSLKARLVLTGRSSLPPREEWEDRLSGHDKRSPTHHKIRKLLEIETLSGGLLVAGADVADPERMREVADMARERFGPVNGIIHAAGVPDGGVIQGRTREMTEAVFHAKIRGTLVLDHIFKDEPLDFFVLCSSIASTLAPVGQVAYSAANAFLDAFALYKTFSPTNRYRFTLAVGWDAWREVGMAAAAGTLEVTHPLLDYRIQGDSNETTYVSRLSVKNHWVLDEHRIIGSPTLPGTACVEMARAAFQDLTGIKSVRMHDVYFLTPLRLAVDEEREVRTVLTKQGKCYKFIIKSPVKEKWQEHAVGELEPVSAEAVKRHDIKALMARCNEEEVILTKEMLWSKREQYDLDFVFGPRWDNIRRMYFGAGRLLIFLELDEEFSGDTGCYTLHPALLDTAVGYYGRKNLIGEASLPFSYKRMQVNAPMTRRVYCYQEFEERKAVGEKILQYNVTVMDEQGVELAVIEEYKRLSVSQDAKSRLAREERAAYPKPVEEPEFLKHGLLPAEGVEVFRRLLERKLPQVVISTRDYMTRREAHYAPAETGAMEELEQPKPPGPLQPRPKMSKVYAPPSGKNEKEIAAIWQDFLGIHQVGIDDDFFELGGDSLKAVTIISQIHKILGVKVPLAEIFNASTVRGLARYITGADKDNYSDIEAVEEKEFYPLSYNQKRLWFIHQLDPGSTSYNISSVIRLGHRVDAGAMEKAFHRLVARHENLRTCIREVTANQPVQVVNKAVKVPFAVLDISSLETGEKEERRERAIAQMSDAPFDIARAPLFRSILVKNNEEEYTLGVTMHHIISDGWSLGILKRELSRLYEGYRNGEEIKPGPPGLQYKDFAAWHNKRLKDSGLKEKSHGYWLNKLESGLPALELPTGFKRGTSTSESAAYRFMIIGQKEDRLKQLAGDNHTSLFMVMFSIFNVMLANFSGQQDIVCGIPAAGREHMLLQNIIGFFVNTLVLKSRVQPDESFTDLLKRVNRDNLEALQHQDYPLELVLDDLQMKFPAITVFFNMRNVPETVTRQEPAPANAYHIEKVQDVNFDITLYIEEYQNGLEVRCHYRKALFKAEAIEHMMGEYLKLLDFFAHQPDKSIKDYKRSRQGRRRVLKKNQ